MIDEAVKNELAPTGVLRAAINMGNFLLVTDRAEDGSPVGVSPDMAAEIARRLGVGLELVPFDTPGAVADASTSGSWDIANIGAEPQRAETIAFSAAYCEIESTYMVPPGSQIESVDAVDAPGNRIAVYSRAAYGLWLQNNITEAQLIHTDSMQASFDAFVAQDLEALAGLRPRLIKDAEAMPGARVLDGKFSAVQQAVGTPIANQKAAAWLASFVEEVKASGFVAGLIDKHDVAGRLSVAPPA